MGGTGCETPRMVLKLPLDCLPGKESLGFDCVIEGIGLLSMTLVEQASASASDKSAAFA